MPIRKCLPLLFCLLILAGCWDKEEIERRSYIVGIGLDKGKNNMLEVTYLLPNPEFGAQIQGGSSTNSSKEIIMMEANDLISSKNRMNTIIAKTITYDQLQFILISEELAKDKDFIRYMYDTTKDVEIRRNINIIVTDESPLVFFKQNQPKMEARVHKYFNLVIENIQKTALAPSNSELLQFFRITEAGSDLFLSLYATTHQPDPNTNVKNKIMAGELPYEGETNETQFAGAAVFKDGKMIGKVTGDEVRIANLINNTVNASNMIVSYPDPFSKKDQIAVKIDKARNNKVRMNLKAETPIIEVTVPIVLEILTNHSMTDDSKKANREKLEEGLRKEIHKEFSDFIERTQKEFKAQPFGWSLNARKKFLTLQQYYDYNFHEKYPEMEVRLNIETRIANYGRQKNIPKIEGVNK